MARPAAIRARHLLYGECSLTGGPQAMADQISRIRVRTAKDEWGVYDPEQAGLAALYARLDNKKVPKAASTAAKPAERKELPTQPTTHRK